MDYTIRRITFGQIVVKFTDGTKAVVAIGTDSSPEEIDHLVSFYDPDLYERIPQSDVLNPNITEGEVRTSARFEEVPEDNPIVPEEPGVPLYSQLLNNATPVIGALRYYLQGDSAPLEALVGIHSTYLPSITSANLVEYFEEGNQSLLDEQAQSVIEAQEAEDIFNQAIGELENG